MKLVCLILLFLLLVLLSSINNNQIINAPTNTIKPLLQESFTSQSTSTSQASGKQVCFDPCPDRNTIRNEILVLKDSIDALQLRMDNYHKQITEIQQGQALDAQDTAQEQAIVNASKDAAKKEAVEALSGPSSDMSGLSKEDTEKALNDHFSEDVDLNDADSSLQNMEPINEDDMINHNKEMAKQYDNQTEKEKEQVSLEVEKTTNQYINDNKAQCRCPTSVTSRRPNIETDIINEANYFGFVKRWHGLRYCSATSDCAKRYAKEKLRELCNESGCQVYNPNGQYPHNLKGLNSNSSDSRPKGYDFPQ